MKTMIRSYLGAAIAFLCAAASVGRLQAGDGFSATLTKTGDLVTGADLTFASYTSARSLYVFFDDVDQGTDSAKWAGSARLADVPAGATQLTVKLPHAAGREYGKLRFALCTGGAGGTATASSYVQNGLVALWDARENTGIGTHSPKPTVWKNLVGPDDLSLSGGGWDFSSENAAHQTNATKRLSLIYSSDALPANSTKTVEVVFRAGTTFDFTQNKRADVVNVCNDGAIALRGGTSAEAEKHRLVGIFVNNSDRKAYYCRNNYIRYNDVETLRSAVSYSELLKPSNTTDTGSSLHANNEQFVKGTKNSFYTATSDFAHNQTITVGVNRGDVYISSVRIYNRELTADERAANYAVDQTRFLSGASDPDASEWTDALTAEVPLNAERSKEGSQDVFDVGFAPSSRTVRKLYVAFGSNRGTQMSGYGDDVDEVATIERGVNSYRYRIPSAKRRLGCRFFLQDVYDTTSYVQENLDAQWDAKENAGRGMHDSSATGMKNLVKDSPDLTVPNGKTAIEVGDDYVKVPVGGKLSATREYSRTDGSWRTIEAAGYVGPNYNRMVSSDRHLLSVNDDCRICFRKDAAATGTIGDKSYGTERNHTFCSANFADKDGNFYFMSPTRLADGSGFQSPYNTWDGITRSRSYSLIYNGSDVAGSNERIDGGLALSTGYGSRVGYNFGPDSHSFCYWTATSTHSTEVRVEPNVTAEGEGLYVNSLRIYTRKLSDEERDWNANVDNCRYAGKALPTEASNFISGQSAVIVFY